MVDKVTDAVGLTNYREAELAQKRATQAAKDSVAFSREQYEDWQEAYEPVQTALSEYFTNLTSDKIIGKKLAATQRETQALEKATEASYAQRGLAGSGLEQQTLSEIRQRGAETRAGIRASADEAVAAQQMDFLKIGLGQGQTLASNVGSAYSTLTNQQQTASSNLYNNSYNMTQTLVQEGAGLAGIKMGQA